LLEHSISKKEDCNNKHKCNRLNWLVLLLSSTVSSSCLLKHWLKVGAQQEAIAAQPLQEQLARYQFQQQLPYQQLQGYLSSVYGTPLGSYGTTVQQAPTYQNRSAGILGGALTGGLGGYALGQAFPAIGAGFGTAGGAALGGLLGAGFFR